MADDFEDGFDTLSVPFIFVKHGDPLPLEWMAEHPGWVKFPAVMIPRDSPDHPANGGKYPNFDALPPDPPPAPVAETQAWPLGRPVSAGLTGRMSRLTPGVPPQYPGGYGAPEGTPEGTPGAGNPVANYQRVNAQATQFAVNYNKKLERPPPAPADAGGSIWHDLAAIGRWINPIASAQAQEADEPNPEERGLFEEFIDPMAEAREQIFWRTEEKIRGLNPSYGTLTPPNYRPSQKIVDASLAGLEATRHRVARQIGNGHAYTKYAAELGANSATEVENLILDAFRDPDVLFRKLKRDRSAFYDQSTNLLVVISPNDPDYGTDYRPRRGIADFYDLD